MSFDVFLSHSSADKPAVEELARRLADEGIQLWLDRWHLIPGDPWQPAIEKALAESKTCAVFVGPSGLGPWQNEEMRTAIDRRVRDSGRRFRVIPILLPGSDRAERSSLPTFLAGTTWVEFRDSLDDQDAFHRLVCGIRGLEPGPGSGQAFYEGQCPYRGLRVFDVDDAAFFFGREALVQWLLNAVRPTPEGQPANRFLAIVGASGSGKSSVARAGLVAALKHDAIAGSSRWPVAILRPGPDPVESLAVALSRALNVGQGAPALGDLIAELQRNEKALHLATRQSLPENASDIRLIVLVDQFEELYTLGCKEEVGDALVRNLLYAARVAQGQTLVILTMRADFYAKCALNAELAAAFSDHHVLVGPMSEDELSRAIERPIHLVGGEVEEGLVDLLLGDVRHQGGALPLLQHALLELWHKREGRRLTVNAYQEIGKVEGALQRRADATLEALSEQERELCRRIFLRLTQPGEGTEDTKRRASIEELMSLADTSKAEQSIIQKLTDASLLTTEGDLTNRDAFVEVAHEALIRNWPQLRKWIDVDRAGLRTRTRLTEATRDWKNASLDPTYLYSGARLAVAEEWAGSHPGELSVDEAEFLRCGLEAQKQREAKELEDTKRLAQAEAEHAVEAEKRLRAEEELRRREVKAAHELTRVESERAAEAEKSREKQAAAARALRNLSLTLAVVALIAAAAAAFGLLKKGEAEKETDRAIQAEREANEARSKAEEQAQAASDARRKAEEQTGLAQRAEQKTREAASQANVSLARYSNEAGNDAQALAHLARALRLSPRNYQAVAFTEMLLTQTGSLLPTSVLKGEDQAFFSAQFSPDGQRMLTVSVGPDQSSTARLWDASSGKPIGEPMRHEDISNSSQFSPDGERVPTGSSDMTARLWDASSGKPIGEPMQHEGPVESAQFSPDGQRVVTASDDNTARLWDALNGKPISEEMRHEGTVKSAQFSPDGQRVVTASDDKTARLWDALNGKPIGAPMKHEDALKSARFSPDGQRVVTASNDNTARLWDASSGKPIGEPMKHEDAVESAQFSPDGQRIVTASDDTTARLWDASSGKPIGEPMKHEDAVFFAQFSPDGQRVATSSRDGTARLWDAQTGEQIGEPMKHQGEVWSAQFSPDGRSIVTVSMDWSLGRVQCWDAATNKEISEPMKHEGRVQSAQFSPNGQRVLTVLEDNTARLWDVQTGEQMGRPMAYEGRVQSARFSSDGQQVLTVTGRQHGATLGCFKRQTNRRIDET